MLLNWLEVKGLMAISQCVVYHLAPPVPLPVTRQTGGTPPGISFFLQGLL